MDELCKKLQECIWCDWPRYDVNLYDEEKGYGRLGCYGDGNIMVIGQNPSNNRYKGNHSFSGSQGDVFREVFGKENIVFTNLVQISTPTNKIEIRQALHGKEHLLIEIQHYKPTIIIACGRFCKDTLQFDIRFSKFPIYYVHHPDYFNYMPSGREAWVEDIKELKKTYDILIKP